jgi:release factor glutamine methyltransferase
MTRIKIGDWQAAARAGLAPISENPGLEAQLLLAYNLDRPRSWILAHPEYGLTSEQLLLLDHDLARLVGGTPLPYLTGRQEFFGLSFHVSPAVLIPRPETELLVERALEWVLAQPGPARVADIGTGSGCIAISIAKHDLKVRVDAVDRSFAALRVAAINTGCYDVIDRVRLIQGNLTTALSGPYSLICANLPYIPSADLNGLPVARHEPLEALDGGEDGLLLIRRLLTQSRRVLEPGGCILLEIEYRQAAMVSDLAQACYPGASVRVYADLAGLDRLVEIRI